MPVLTEYISTDHHLDCGHVIGVFVATDNAGAVAYFDTMSDDSYAVFTPDGAVVIVCSL